MSQQHEEGPHGGQMEHAAGKGRSPARRGLIGAIARAGLVAATVLAVMWPSTSQAATRSATLQSRLLSVADLPAGWSAAPTNALKTLQATRSPCLAGLKGATFVSMAFVEGVVPELAEALASGARAREAWQQFGAALAGCRADVLGHSMGTAVAQALAVLHPREVRRLVLCAPYPGNGAVVLSPGGAERNE